MIEELFGYSAGNRNSLKDKELPSMDPAAQNISLLNVKKSCNLAVVFKAMNVRVQEIHDALIEGICLSTNTYYKFTHVACLTVFFKKDSLLYISKYNLFTLTYITIGNTLASEVF
jgi:hypothetical protein